MKVRIKEVRSGRVKTVSQKYADVLVRLGRYELDSAKAQSYQTREMRAAPAEDLTVLRAEYQEAVGKRAFHGWGAAELRKRIAEFKAED